MHFRIRDVYVPDAADVLEELHGNDILQGRVVDYADNGSTDRVFAIVNVQGLSQPVFIATDKILDST